MTWSLLKIIILIRILFSKRFTCLKERYLFIYILVRMKAKIRKIPSKNHSQPKYIKAFFIKCKYFQLFQLRCKGTSGPFHSTLNKPWTKDRDILYKDRLTRILPLIQEQFALLFLISLLFIYEWDLESVDKYLSN